MREGSKKIIAWCTCILGVLTLGIFKIVPLMYDLIMSLKAYTMHEGFFNSPWVGLENYINLFQTFQLKKVWINTILLNITFILVSSLFVFIMCWALNSIEAIKWKKFFAIIFVLPFFIPKVVYAWVIITCMNINQLNTLEFYLVYALAELIRTGGVFIMIASLFVWDKGKVSFYKGIGAGMALFLLIKLGSVLHTNFDLVHSMTTSENLWTMNTIDFYIFRIGIMGGEFSLGSAQWVLKNVIQLILIVLCMKGGKLLIDRYYYKDFKKEVSKKSSRNNRQSKLAVVLCSFYALFLVGIFFQVFTPLKYSGYDLMSGFEKIGIMLVLAFTGTVLATVLAYPFYIKKFSLKPIYTFFIILCLYSGIGNVGSFMMGIRPNLLNRIFNVGHNFFPVIGIFILMIYFYIQKDKISKNYLKQVYPPALLLFALQFALNWNSFYKAQLGGIDNLPILSFKSLIAQYSLLVTNGMDLSLMPGLALAISLPPILLFLVTLGILWLCIRKRQNIDEKSSDINNVS